MASVASDYFAVHVHTAVVSYCTYSSGSLTVQNSKSFKLSTHLPKIRFVKRSVDPLTQSCAFQETNGQVLHGRM